MKLKYYLRGLGSGIIIATSVLAITFAITNRDANIIQKAKELGMVFADETENSDKTSADNVENNEKNTSSSETSASETSSSEENTKEQSDDTTKDSKEEDTTKATEETTTENKEEDTTKKMDEEGTTTSNDKGDDTYTLTIKRGMTSESVSTILYNYGVVDSRDKFNDYLVSNGYSKKLKIGVFELTKGDSYKNIARKITGK